LRSNERADFFGRVVGVSDGDSISVMRDGNLFALQNRPSIIPPLLEKN
jgi:hypothetical protein